MDTDTHTAQPIMAEITELLLRVDIAVATLEEIVEDILAVTVGVTLAVIAEAALPIDCIIPKTQERIRWQSGF